MIITSNTRPYALRRHRHTKMGRTYDPDTDRKRLWLQSAHGVKRMEPFDAFLKMHCVFTFKRPKTKSKFPFPTKCDLDNVVKFYLDALNKKCFADDRQIVEIHAKKIWGDFDQVQIQFTELV